MNIENSKTLNKISYIFNKTLVLSIICDECGGNDKKYSKKKSQLRYLNSWFNE